MLLGLIRDWVKGRDVGRPAVPQPAESGGLTSHREILLWQKALDNSKRKQFKQSATVLQDLLERNPQFWPGWLELGNALVEQDLPPPARLAYRNALTLQPKSPDALIGLGIVANAERQFEEALGYFDAALALDSTRAHAYFNRASSYLDMGNFDAALEAVNQAQRHGADASIVKGLVGVIHHKMGNDDLGMEHIRAALKLNPQNAKFHLNLAVIHSHNLRFDEAKRSFDAAIQHKLGYESALFYRSQVDLIQGQFKRGWRDFEFRPYTNWYRKLPSWKTPQWRGEKFAPGQSIFVHSEQGLGDTLQFVRYVPLLAERGVKVLLRVQPALRTVLAGMSGVDTWLEEAEVPERMDWHCPLMSLPLAFGTDLSNIPARLPYLQPSQSGRQKIAVDRSRLNVGLVWSGNPKHVNDRMRSIPLTELQGLLDMPVRWHVLQKELRAGDAAWLKRPNVNLIGPGFKDFVDTAQAIDALDWVVTVDTSVAHLSAAMGKPTWILLAHSPDYRWLLDREDSPWYPGVVRLFRQDDSRQWGPVLQRVCEALEKRVQEQG